MSKINVAFSITVLKGILLMDDKEKIIIEKILSDNSSSPLDSEKLRLQLDKELAKPQPDFDFVDELTLAIIEAENKTVPQININNEISEIKRKAICHKKIFKLPRWLSAVSIACIIFVCANIFTSVAWGTNLFESIITINKTDTIIDFKNKPNKEIMNSYSKENDPYGIKSECAKHGIYTLTPYYIPEIFELESVTISDNNIHYHEKKYKCISFKYVDTTDERSRLYCYIKFNIISFENPDDMELIGDSIQSINGKDFYMTGTQYAEYKINDNTKIEIMSEFIENDEFQKILESIGE